MTIEQIDKAIFWQEHVRDTTRDKTQRDRCNARIERLMRERMELTRAKPNNNEAAAWYDTSAELR